MSDERNGPGWIGAWSGSIVAGAVASGTSSIDVSNYYYNTVQPVVTGPTPFVTISLQSSLDQSNWSQDFVITATAASSSLNAINGKRVALRACYGIGGNATCSVHILSGN